MKRTTAQKFILAITLLLVCSATVFARTQYDETGRYIIKSDTIRNKNSYNSRAIQGMAAAKINYSEEYANEIMKTKNSLVLPLKSNYIQSR